LRPAPVAPILLGALVVAPAGVVAAMVYLGESLRGQRSVGGLTALSCIRWSGTQVTGENVRAVGVDSAGILIEPRRSAALASAGACPVRV
jgi:hypothetical protein